MLKSLRLTDVGPAPSFDIDFTDRLNIFTGDNGLGKSFILDTMTQDPSGMHERIAMQLFAMLGIAAPREAASPLGRRLT